LIIPDNYDGFGKYFGFIKAELTLTAFLLFLAARKEQKKMSVALTSRMLAV
jgi:hypothetical protein